MGHGHAGILLHGSVSGSMAEGADLEETQPSAGGPSREGGEDLPDLSEAMAGGARPEEL